MSGVFSRRGGQAPKAPPSPPAATPAEPDPSMEDILASIRRILNEGESETVEAPAEAVAEAVVEPVAQVVPTPAPAAAAPPVSEPAPVAPAVVAPVVVTPVVAPVVPPAVPPAVIVAAAPQPPPEVVPAATIQAKEQQKSSVEPKKTVEANEVFILEPAMMVTESAQTAEADASPIASSETVSAASQSVGALKKALAERNAQVYRLGNVSLEDLVRDEVRPMLKDWLDTHLPAIVERLVRAEIERVVAREIL
jgi:cell pole-organizing protein PopZ